MDNWFNRSFGDDYLIVYKHRDLELAKVEAQAMTSWLQLNENAQLLDLCCGMGRHAMALQELGYSVTGMDLSDALLRVAREIDYLNQVNWIQGDMREIPFEHHFDAVVNLFTSFGYFDAEEENIAVLKQIRKALKPDGVWLIDFLNPLHVKANLIPRSERLQDGCKIIETRDIVQNRVEKTIELTRASGEQVQYIERVNLYEREWFEKAFKEVGLQLDCVYGDYFRGEYGAASPRMIMIGRVAN